MPRKRRLEFPGEIHHVMTRGLNGMLLFKDEYDKQQMLDYLSKYLPLTECRCYAWALLDNHYHLLIRTGQYRLGETMLRIHTAYSMYFNRKYKRRGYVFQDRYKSIVTADYHYIRWLIAYIHLNPLRAGIVKTLKSLGHYSWCSHGMVINNKQINWFYPLETLRRFGINSKDALCNYRLFLQGINSSDYSENPFTILDTRKLHFHDNKADSEEKEFTSLPEKESTLYINLQEEYKQKQIQKMKYRQSGWDIERMACYVCKLIGTEREGLFRRGYNDKSTESKALLCYWSYRELGIPMIKIGDYLGLSNSTVSRLVERGRQLALKKDILFN